MVLGSLNKRYETLVIKTSHKGILELRDYVFISTRTLHINEDNLIKILIMCNVLLSVKTTKPLQHRKSKNYIRSENLHSNTH